MKKPSGVVPPDLRLDRASSRPMQRQLFDGLREAIALGTLRPGVRLPSTRDLARDLGVSRNCVVNAFRYLAAQGLIESRSGAGTRVTYAVRVRPRIPPSTRRPPSRRATRLERVVTDISSGAPGPFRPGVPPVDLFPVRTWRSLLSRRWRTVDAALLAYDEGTGYAPLREAIAAHLGIARGVRCDAAQVVIVSGAQQAIDMTARVLLEPGDSVCVEDPGFFGSRAAFAACGAQIMPVPVDEGGIDVDAGRERCPQPRLIYVTPAHQYPMGVTMTAERRQALLQWVAESGAWLIEDDFGGEVHYSGPRPKSLQGLDANASVIFIGTFSLALAPAMRIGYIVAPRDLVSAFNVARSIAGRGPSAIEQATLADFMAGGHLALHLRRIHDACAERRQTLIDALTADFPLVRRIAGSAAGMHLVGYIDGDDVAISAAALRAGIEVPALRSFAIDASPPPALLFGYGSVEPKAIRGAVGALRRLL